MSNRRYLILPILALIAVIAVQASTTVRPSAASVASGSADTADPYVEAGVPGDTRPIVGVDTSDIDRRIAFWQERIRNNPRSETAFRYLGDLYDLKGRATGDVSQYLSAREAYRNALDVAPRATEARAGLARILVTLHDFRGAIDEALVVIQDDPGATGAIGVLFDASVEVGDLEAADRAIEILRDRVDGAPVRVREARLAYLRGGTDRAVELADAAVEEAEALGELPASFAFYHYTAGEYRLLAGDPGGAAAAYARSLDALPGYVLAIAGEGRAAFAQGDLSTAVERYRAAAAAAPRPEVLAYLGDLLALSGDAAGAEEQYGTVDFINGLAENGPLVHDREYALFLADHARQVERAVELTTAEIEVRQDVHGYDVHAWALHAAGRHEEALDAARSALALGTHDARILYHAGIIELANGLASEGRAHLEQALALHPAFSPLAIERMREALGR